MGVFHVSVQTRNPVKKHGRHIPADGLRPLILGLFDFPIGHRDTTVTLFLLFTVGKPLHDDVFTASFSTALGFATCLWPGASCCGHQLFQLRHVPLHCALQQEDLGQLLRDLPVPRAQFPTHFR